MRDSVAMAQSGSKWSQVLENLNKQDEAGDGKRDVNVLKTTTEIDKDSSTSLNMSSNVGFRLWWLEDFFSISPTTKYILKLLYSF